ncbi:MAG TPA: MFS transporter [Candidatus Megaira endosymbiont of Hartmannula sinica]|nr:MFS transporter [Candidatus Megaera endosymbiont of Hartmannula sinica]
MPIKQQNILRCFLWFLASFFMAFQFVVRLSVGVLKEKIINKFSMNLAEFGTMAGFYYISYAGGQIPMSLLIEKYRVKYVLPFAIILTSTGCVGFALSNSIYILYFSRFVIGLGSAAAFVSIVKIVTTLFDDKYYSILISISISIAMVGAIMGTTPMYIIFNKFGYENSFYILSLFSLILSILIFVISSIVDNDLPSQSKLEEKVSTRNILYTILTNKFVFILSISGGRMVGSLEGFADVWGISYIEDVYNINREDATKYISLIYIGMCIGSPILSLFAFLINSENISLTIISILTSFIFYILLYKHTIVDSHTLYLLMFFIGILCSYQCLVFVSAKKYIKSKVLTISIAVINSINMSFGHFFHSIIGNAMYNIKQTNSDILISDLYIYSLKIIPICSVISIIGFVYLIYFDHSKK